MSYLECRGVSRGKAGALAAKCLHDTRIHYKNIMVTQSLLIILPSLRQLSAWTRLWSLSQN